MVQLTNERFSITVFTVFMICFTLASLNADYVPAIATAITFTNFATTDNEFHDRNRGRWFVRENSHIVTFYLHALQYLMQRSWVGF